MTSRALRPTRWDWLPTVATVGALLCMPMQATAQWIWLDDAGRKVFSDQAPPTSVPDNRILKRQGQPARTNLPGEAKAEARPETKPQPSQHDGTELERKAQALKEQQEAQVRAQAAVQKAKDDEAIAENCQRAQRSQTSLQSGARQRTTNAQGEYEIMSDAARDAELQRIAAYMQTYCNK